MKRTQWYVQWFIVLVAAASVTACGDDGSVSSSPHSQNNGTDTGWEVDSGKLDSDQDGTPDDDDCAPGDPSIFPGADEVCDGVDNDCDGEIDEDATDAGSWYVDGDGDGYGQPGSAEVACEAPEGYVDNADDCNDNDTAYYPGATEDDCSDPNDYNCDGSVGFADADNDGHAACDDCNDENASVYPGQFEMCDGVDNSCSGSIDDGALDQQTFYADSDGDGYGDPNSVMDACQPVAGYVADASDCDDTSDTTYPGAAETCDQVDNDCDGTVDEDASDATVWYRDGDGDGHGDDRFTQTACAAPSGYVSDAGDCNDSDSAYHPGATEDDCSDPNDYNCDGSVAFADADNDGHAACEDCDDADAMAHPNQYEVCDGVDNDCDGSVDEADAVNSGTFYVDADGDGFGDGAQSAQSCGAPTGYVANANDCDDQSASAYPGADEVCDQADNDCDGSVDEDATDAPTWYADTDGDGHGTSRFTATSCSAPSGYTDTSDDCDDLEADAYPSNSEVCDGIDNDCDGVVDENDAIDAPSWYADADGDGFGDPNTATKACDAPTGQTSDNTDCNDAEASVYPGGTELCDGLDNNCDATVDEGVLGSGSACPAQTCLEVLDDQPSASTGSYYLDPDSSGSREFLCDMTTDGGGWTYILRWDRLNNGDRLADLEASMIEDINDMGNWGESSSYIQWNDGNSNADVMAFHLPVSVPNGGDVMVNVYDYEYSPEDSAVFYYATANSTDTELVCNDGITPRSSWSSYTSAERAYKPGFTCSRQRTASTNLQTTVQKNLGSQVDTFHMRSFHYDNGSGDWSYLYYLNVAVR